jgi:hypothetical protein
MNLHCSKSLSQRLDSRVIMRRAFRIFNKTPAVQASAITVGPSALAHSAEATDFGFVSLNNAQGASEAIAELSQYLDESLNDFEFDGGDCVLLPSVVLWLTSHRVLEW